MYKFERYRQLGLADFNQPVGLKMNLENRWVKKAETIPWDTIEEKYARLFSNKTGVPTKPLRMALGSLLIQKQLGSSVCELLWGDHGKSVFPVFHRGALCLMQHQILIL